MKRSPAKRHVDALARSGSETVLSRPSAQVQRPAQRGLSQTHSAADLHRDQADPDMGGRGGGLQRTPSRGSMSKSNLNLKQLPPLEAPTMHKNPRDREKKESRGEKKESTKKEVGGLKNRTAYGAAVDAFERPAGYIDDSIEHHQLPAKDSFEEEVRALREAAANKAKKESAKQQQAKAEAEHAADTATGHDTQEAHEASSSQCYFKPDPYGPFRDHNENVPEKPAGPPPLSDAEKDLMGAVCGGDLEKAEALLSEHGPSLLSGHGGGGITTTAILYAAQAGNKEMCDLLVAYGGVQVLEKGRDIKSRGPAEYAEKAGHGPLASHLKSLESKSETKQDTKKTVASEPTWRP